MNNSKWCFEKNILTLQKFTINLLKKQMCAIIYNSERVVYLMNNCNCEGA